MDWSKLKIFHTVAETGSFTGAGKSLGLSQSVVSRHISSLENNLGVGLFRRHSRGLVLTEQGELLHNTTQDVYKKLSVIKGQLMDTRHLPEGPLTITISDFLGLTWLAPRLGEFKSQYPDIQLTVIFEDRVLNLNLKQADGAIRLHKPTNPDLIQRHLATMHFHICASKKYLKKQGYPKTVKDLQNHCLIAFPENMVSPIPNPNWLFETAGVNIRDNQNLLMVNSMYAINKSVEAGAGIAVLPDYLIAANSEFEVILPSIKRPTVDLYFTYPEERKNSKRLALFRDFLLENIEKTRFKEMF